jgi:hypothetical protein
MRIRKQGNYIVITDDNDKELFNVHSSRTDFVKNESNEIDIFDNGIPNFKTSALRVLESELKDEVGGELEVSPISWLRGNTGFNTASGGSGAKSISAATYTILSTDTNKYLEFSNACVVTVPLGLAASLEFEGEQVGTGEVSFVSAATGTLNRFADFDNKTAGQFSPFGIRTKGSNVATLIGTLKLA